MVSDRAYWVDMLCKIAEPVLSNMAKGELQKNMILEFSPQWDGRDKRVAYMETFGRLMAGLSPWLNCRMMILRRAGKGHRYVNGH